MNSTNTFVALIVFLTILAVGTLAATAGEINNYDINRDGCVTRSEVDDIVAILAPEAETLVDEEDFVVFRAPNQTHDMAVEFGEDGCATSSELIAKVTA